GAIRLDPFQGQPSAAAASRFKYLADGPLLQVNERDAALLPELHRQQLVLVQEDAQGTVLDATRIQAAGALDDLYAAAAKLDKLGVDIADGQTRFSLWAPTARQAAVCVYRDGSASSSSSSSSSA